MADKPDPPRIHQKRLETVADLIYIAGRLDPSTAVVPGGHRVEDLRLVESARDHGVVDRIVLVGRKDRIAAAVAEANIDVSQDDIVAADSDEEIAAATVELIRAGGVDIVLKGDISTPVINRRMLPLAIRPTVSLATVFDAAPLANGRPMLMTDAGVTTVCSPERMAGLVRNAIDVAQTVMGINRPRVAILSANEKQIASLPSTRMGLELASRDWPDAVVCGPLSFDLATDPASVAIKGLPDVPRADEVAGRADVLVCPGLDTANVLYKTIAAMNKYGAASLASITVGFPVPYVILSRADSLEVRLASIALCAIYARRRPQDRPPAEPVSPPAPADTPYVLDRIDDQPEPCNRQEIFAMSRTEKSRWVFRAHVVDRAGALTSIASAFSNEGVSIDTVVGHGFQERAGMGGSVVLTFNCSEADKDKMVRKVKRLSKVMQLEERPYESQSLRKSVLLLTARELKPRDVVGDTTVLTSELVKTEPRGWTYLLAGSPSELDPILDRLETEGLVKDVIYSVLSL